MRPERQQISLAHFDIFVAALVKTKFQGNEKKPEYRLFRHPLFGEISSGNEGTQDQSRPSPDLTTATANAHHKSHKIRRAAQYICYGPNVPFRPTLFQILNPRNEILNPIFRFGNPIFHSRSSGIGSGSSIFQIRSSGFQFRSSIFPPAQKLSPAGDLYLRPWVQYLSPAVQDLRPTNFDAIRGFNISLPQLPISFRGFNIFTKVTLTQIRNPISPPEFSCDRKKVHKLIPTTPKFIPATQYLIQ